MPELGTDLLDRTSCNVGYFSHQRDLPSHYLSFESTRETQIVCADRDTEAQAHRDLAEKLGGPTDGDWASRPAHGPVATKPKAHAVRRGVCEDDGGEELRDCEWPLVHGTCAMRQHQEPEEGTQEGVVGVTAQCNGQIARLGVFPVRRPELDGQVVHSRSRLPHNQFTVAETERTLVVIPVRQDRTDPVASDDEVQDEEDETDTCGNGEHAHWSEEEGDHEIEHVERLDRLGVDDVGDTEVLIAPSLTVVKALARSLGRVSLPARRSSRQIIP